MTSRSLPPHFEVGDLGRVIAAALVARMYTVQTHSSRNGASSGGLCRRQGLPSVLSFMGSRVGHGTANCVGAAVGNDAEQICTILNRAIGFAEN